MIQLHFFKINAIIYFIFIFLEQCWGYASRLPNDSRIPKSSSVPEKMISSKVINKKVIKKNSNNKVVAPSTIKKNFISKNTIDFHKSNFLFNLLHI